MLQTWTSFVTVVIALSVSVERIVEILKGLFSKLWLFTPSVDPAIENRRCACLHIVAALCGFGVALLTHVHLLPTNGTAPNDPDLKSAVLGGLLASGGSAFWNHILDILKAVKVDRELKAIRELQLAKETNRSVQLLS